jgi:hypothetical protein
MRIQRDGEYEFYLRAFCNYPHRGVHARHYGYKSTEYKSTDSSLPSIKCNVLRESRSEDSQNIPCAALKKRGSWVISVSYNKQVLRIRDVYPGFRILIFTHHGSRIPDLGSRIQKEQQKRGVKKNCCHTFFFSHKFHKIEIYFILLFSQKYGFGIRNPEKTYSGSRIRNTAASPSYIIVSIPYD